MSVPLSLNIFTENEIRRWFTFYSVNAKVLEKKFVPKDGVAHPLLYEQDKLVEEYRLPIYDPLLQERGFMETSCYIHVLDNELYRDYEWLGITQYDMRWTTRSKKILHHIESPTWWDRVKGQISAPIVFAQIAARKSFLRRTLHPMASANTFNWKFLLESYNRFFLEHHLIDEIANAPLSLWQTYLMPRKTFVELASWLKILANEIYPWANEAPYETHWGVLGGLTERAEALFMAIRHAQGSIRLTKLHLEHDELIPQQLQIAKNHYA